MASASAQIVQGETSVVHQTPPIGLSFSGIHLLHTEPLPSLRVRTGGCLRGNMINY